MANALFILGKGFNRKNIMAHARELMAEGLFSKWIVTKRERWGLCLKAAWSNAKHERYSVEYQAKQDELTAYIESINARDESNEPIHVEHREMTAQEMINHVYKTAGTLD